MAPAMYTLVAFMLATAMVEANQCTRVGECPSDDKPQNVVSLLHMNVLKDGGGGDAPAAVLSQRSDGPGDVPSSPRVAFLVRTYAPTPTMTKRIAQWVSNLPSDVDAFISIDQSIETNTVSPLLKTLRSTGFNLSHIHRYTTDDMLYAYPALNGKAHPAYQYITAAVDLFVQNLTHKYDYLWILEDDVGYTGNISTLLEKYSGNADDLIGGAIVPIIERADDDVQTDLYKEWVPLEQRVMSENHVVRMSSKLLGRLNHWMKAGAIHCAEEMSPTVCEMEHMKCSALAKADLGAPYGIPVQEWSDGFPVVPRRLDSSAKWEAIQRQDAESGKPRLYHPLKI